MSNIPDFTSFVAWLKTQKQNTQFNFESPTDCVVARYLKAIFPDGYDIDNWSSIFPGMGYMDRLRAYHDICNQKPFDYAGVLKRVGNYNV